MKVLELINIEYDIFSLNVDFNVLKSDLCSEYILMSNENAPPKKMNISF